MSDLFKSWAERMVKATDDAMGNNATNLGADCSTGKGIAAALREMAERPDKWWHQEEIDELAEVLEGVHR
jgi:hypothetical protein